MTANTTSNLTPAERYLQAIKDLDKEYARAGRAWDDEADDREDALANVWAEELAQEYASDLPKSVQEEIFLESFEFAWDDLKKVDRGYRKLAAFARKACSA